MNKILALVAIFAVSGGVYANDPTTTPSTISKPAAACHIGTNTYCTEKYSENDIKKDIANCNAKMGGIVNATKNLQDYTNILFDTSFDYLWISSNFGSFSRNRPGFEKTFKELSDSTWNKGVEMIKYMAKRGGSHKFEKLSNKVVSKNNYALYEAQAMATALDVEKELFIDANKIHKSVSHPHSAHAENVHYDAEIAHFIDEKILEDKSENIRKFSGHLNDLVKFSKDTSDISLALYLFDQTL